MLLGTLTLDPPRVAHGADIQRLIGECAPLDVNSTYAYLLLCEHHAATCVHAALDGRTVGFVSGYQVPARTDVLFVWQVAVAAQMRGRGLAKTMLLDLLSRPHSKDCHHLETTISPSNAPSRALFHSLAHTLCAPVTEKPLFLQQHFGKDSHEPEILVRIGPFASP